MLSKTQSSRKRSILNDVRKKYMIMIMIRRIKIYSIVIICLFIFGCVSAPYKMHPGFHKKIKEVKTLVIMPPAVNVYQITAGGLKEKMDTWTDQARQNVLKAIEDEINKKNDFKLTICDINSLDSKALENLEETNALYEAVDTAIMVHAYGPGDNYFPEKEENFQYSLGREVKDISGSADIMLFVRGIDHITTSGRKAVMAGQIILGALIGVAFVPQGGVTIVSIAIVDADTGSILWHSAQGSSGDYDLRKESSATRLIKSILGGFPPPEKDVQ